MSIRRLKECDRFMDENSFSIRGIQFKKDELDIITFEELSKYKISPGHLFYFSKIHNKPFFMLQAGDFIQKSFLEKYSKSGFQSFYMLKTTDDELVEQFKFLWDNFRMAKREEDRWKVRNEILHQVKLFFWESGRRSFLDYMFVCMNVFDKTPDKIYSKYLDISDSLIRRSALGACFSTIFALSLGYLDFNFIQDLFHASLLKDYGLMSEDYHFCVEHALELERNAAGSGIEYLKKTKQSQKTIDLYLNHPKISYELVMKEFKDQMHEPGVYKSINYHHEKKDGSGFPFQINYLGVSDWEAILTLVEYMIPYEEICFNRFNGDYKIKTLINSVNEQTVWGALPVNRIKMLITGVLGAQTKKVTEA